MDAGNIWNVCWKRLVSSLFRDSVNVRKRSLRFSRTGEFNWGKSYGIVR